MIISCDLSHIFTRNYHGKCRAQMQYPYFSTQSHPPSIYGWIYAALKGITQDPYPYLDKICDKSQEIIMVSAEPTCSTHPILALSLTRLVYSFQCCIYPAVCTRWVRLSAKIWVLHLGYALTMIISWDLSHILSRYGYGSWVIPFSAAYIQPYILGGWDWVLK